MTLSDPLGVLLLGVIALIAGVVNTVVGSGTLLTFPALLAFGVPAVPANIANSAGLAIGNIAGVLGYRDQLVGQWRRILPLIVATVIGAVGGAVALLMLPASVFTFVAPALIIIGCLLVLVQPIMNRRRGAPVAAEGRASPLRWRIATALMTLTGAYGGYFGAAQGVIIVGVLDVMLDEDLQRVNAIKNVLQTVAGWTASLIFIFVTSISWGIVLVIAVGSFIGARLGAVIGHRIPAWALRMFVVIIGVASVFVLLVR